MRSVSCAACHAPAALRMVDLRLYDPATKTWAAEKPGEPWFEKLAKSVDADGNGLDARELLELVKKINPEGAAAPRTFRGRIELRSNVEAHRLAEKGAAIRACDSCHSAGAEPFRNVTVSVTGPGRAGRCAMPRSRQCSAPRRRWFPCRSSTPSAARAARCWTSCSCSRCWAGSASRSVT